jgi:hypothetical protein
VVRDIGPETIINVAAPASTNTLTPHAKLEEVIVKAQDTLISLAKEVGIKYMICTTSANVVEALEHASVDKQRPFGQGTHLLWEIISNARRQKDSLWLQIQSFCKQFLYRCL